MDIAVAMIAHPEQPSLIIDTLDSILTYCTDKILVVVDAVGWDNYKNLSLPANKVEGFRHGKPRAPYKNMALSLKLTLETWPDIDWLCYCDYDVLFASDRFKRNLEMASDMGIWMMGNDGHIDDTAMPLLDAMIGEPLKSCYYLLGALQFFHRNYLQKLTEINFFDRFLNLTSGFDSDFFPFYSGYDISEHMYPTLCRHFGGNIGVFSSWDGKEWHGAYEYFPVRWKPELEADGFEKASVLHPVKLLDHPIRVREREKRRLWKDLKEKEKQSA